MQDVPRGQVPGCCLVAWGSVVPVVGVLGAGVVDGSCVVVAGEQLTRFEGERVVCLGDPAGVPFLPLTQVDRLAQSFKLTDSAENTPLPAPSRAHLLCPNSGGWSLKRFSGCRF